MSKDIKRMVTEIRGALDAYPREQLQEILAWVFKEYVVEGGTAPAQGALAMLDARTELEGLSFAELVTWLQLHLDVPELAALEVQGARVSVRAGGRSIPIEVAAPPPAAPPVAAPTSTVAAPTSTVAAPTSTVAAPAPAIPPPQAMPPPNPPPPSHAAPPPSPPNQAPSAAPADKAKDDDKKEDAASRFSWLEVD